MSASQIDTIMYQVQEKEKQMRVATIEFGSNSKNNNTPDYYLRKREMAKTR